MINYENVLQTISIKRTNPRGHTTIIEGPNLFCQKRSFNSPPSTVGADLKPAAFFLFSVPYVAIHWA